MHLQFGGLQVRREVETVYNRENRLLAISGTQTSDSNPEHEPGTLTTNSNRIEVSSIAPSASSCKLRWSGAVYVFVSSSAKAQEAHKTLCYA